MSNIPEGFNTVSAYVVLRDPQKAIEFYGKAFGAKPGAIMHMPDDSAIDAGCEVAAPLMDAFRGDRFGKVTDPFGIQWSIATHKEDLSDEEIKKRGAEWFASMAQGDSRS